MNSEQAHLQTREAALAGAACLWLRNAVDDAMDAVQDLRAAGVAADLLHARYTMADRLRLETEVQARFGKIGNRSVRARADRNASGRSLAGSCF